MKKQEEMRIARRSFLYGAAGTMLALHAPAWRLWGQAATQEPSGTDIDPDNCLFVSLNGDDNNPGTEALPLRSFHAAQKAVARWKQSRHGAITVFFRAGTYYLPDTIIFSPEDSGEQQAPVIYASYPGEQAILSGGNRIDAVWKPYCAHTGVTFRSGSQDGGSRLIAQPGDRGVAGRQGAKHRGA